MASSSRATLHSDIARKFVDSWNGGFDTDATTFLEQFSPAVLWHEHAFRVKVKGHGQLLMFRAGWLQSVEQFRCDVRSIKPTDDGAVIQCVYHGVMQGPLWKLEASGLPLVKEVVIVLGIVDNKIQQVDEYYNPISDAGGDLNTYISPRQMKL